MIINQDLLRPFLLLIPHHLPHNHEIPARRERHDDADPEQQPRTQQDSQEGRDDPKDDAWHQSAPDVMALRQGRGTGAVRCQVLLHEPEIDVFEMMLCKHAPSQAVDELVGHDEHYEYDDEQQTLLGRRPQQRHGILPCKKQHADGGHRDGEQ